ncbi:hypothetical protein AMTR_s00133p00089650 [Amborella trichopoda]|uniref:F-box/LRR-repeat protein 15-like leucin rich repeat domain-containing protein n=1 Tax=Amborella trichopoda TaxID=13333 RepID=W1P9S1_AMBTC|nr:hypothetical protein AMTR_s00133p00089650 [Amborella trichopoda]
MNNAGERLLAALSLPRYQHVKYLNLEFAQDIEDKHVMQLKGKSLMDLRSLNLNGCQKISDDGIEAVTAACPNIRIFSIYWNVRVTYVSVKHLVNNCKEITELNLSGCKKISVGSWQLIADHYSKLEVLNLTRCIKLTDNGLQQILLYCPMIMSLNLYALSSLTDNAYQMISFLTNLRFLDLCGAQNLSDQGLSSIAKCKNLVSLNLTWCVNVTDVGVLALASTCTSLEYLRGGIEMSCWNCSQNCVALKCTADGSGNVNGRRFNDDDKFSRHMSNYNIHVAGMTKIGNAYTVTFAPLATDTLEDFDHVIPKEKGTLNC